MWLILLWLVVSVEGEEVRPLKGQAAEQRWLESDQVLALAADAATPREDTAHSGWRDGDLDLLRAPHHHFALFVEAPHPCFPSPVPPCYHPYPRQMVQRTAMPPDGAPRLQGTLPLTLATHVQ